jgi:hypothetical protein
MKNTRILSFIGLFLIVFLLIPALANAESFKVRVVVQGANVHLKPDAESAVIKTMPLGSVLEAEEGTVGWYKVTLPPDENGFVVIGYLQKDSTELAEAEVPKQKIATPPVQPVITSPQPQIPQMAPPPRRSGGMELGIRLSGGAGMLFGVNHINDYFQGVTDFYYDEATYMYSSYAETSGQLDPLKTGLYGGMELFFNINPYIGFGFGIGYLGGKKDAGTISIVDDWDGYAQEQSNSHQISAIPVLMTVYGGLPLGRMMRIVPYLGVGYYLGTVTYEENYLWEDTWYNDYYQWDAVWTGKASALGFHGGVNFDFYFTRNIGMFLGFGGVVATLQDIVGDSDWEESDSWGWSDSGTERDQQLWAGREEWFTSATYPWMYIDSDEPSSIWTTNVETGKISLSHFRFVIGIVVFFMR